MKVINYKKKDEETIELAIEATDEEIGYLVSIALDVLIAADKITQEELDAGNVQIDLADFKEEDFYTA